MPNPSRPRELRNLRDPWRFVYRPLLIVTFVVTVLCFTLSTHLTALRVEALASWSNDMYGNALPSMAHLGLLRSRVHTIERELDTASERKAYDAKALEDALEGLTPEASAVLAFPHYPGEQQLWADASRALDALEDDVKKIRAREDAGDRVGAESASHADLRRDAQAADDALVQLIGLHARQAEVSGAHLEASNRRFAQFAYGFDAASLLLSGALFGFAFRAIHRVARISRDRAAELEQFASRVAHDIRGLLTPVSVALSLLAKRTLDDDSKRYVELGTRSLRHVDAVVTALYQFASSGARPKPGAHAALHAAIDEVVAEVAPLASETEVEALPFEDRNVACDPGVLGVILSNLVRNAIKHMGKSPSKRCVTLRVSTRKDSVRVEVEDSGPGLSPTAKELVFEPYVRGDDDSVGGLGLGLATVKRLVEAHKGVVGVESTEGKGSTFWFELPGA